MDSAHRGWWHILFPGPAPNVLALLVAQGEVTEEGLRHCAAWSATGSPKESEEVTRCHIQAYEARRTVLAALQAALSTPLDQEDVYILSERLDRVLNEAKDAVREAEVLGWRPDSHVKSMGRYLAQGTAALVTGLRLLPHDLAGAGRQADEATGLVRHVEHRYREAMTELLGASDLRTVIAAQDLYRRHARVADHIVAVADRLWYAVLRGT
jgi:uncharacterized protein Yka (UPF0111/DUF47 family)